MKKMNISHNSKHFLNVLLLILMLVGINTNVWGYYTSHVNVYSSPENGGWVYVNTSNSQPGSYTLTSNNATIDGGKLLQTSGNNTFYLCNKPNAGDGYVFKGWATSENENTGEEANDNPFAKSVSGSSKILGGTTHNFYAIFAKMTADKSSIAFGEKLVGLETDAVTITVSHAHAGSITAEVTAGNTGDFVLSKTAIVTSVAEGTATFTVKFRPTAAGSRSATLTISSNNGLSSINISLTGTGMSVVEPVYTCNIADEYFVDDTSLDLESLWTSTSNGNKTYSIVSFTPSSENNTGLIAAPAITGNRTLSLGQAGTLVLSLSQEAISGYYAGEGTKTITISKRTPSFTWNAGGATYYYGSTIPSIFSTSNTDFGYTIVSNNEAAANVIDSTLHIYNVEETATITATQVENYKWNEKVVEYVVTPVELNNHVPFTITSSNYNTPFHYNHSGSFFYNTNGVQVGDGGGGFNWDDKYYDIAFTGIPDKLSFEYETASGAAYTGVEWWVKESADGTNWVDSKWGTKDNNSGTASNIQLLSTTRYLRFCYSGNFGGRFKNINVTELNHFAVTPALVDFGTKGVNFGTQEETVIFNHANAGRITTMEIVGDDAEYFSIERSTIPGTGRDLYATTNIVVSFDNKKGPAGHEPEYSAVLRIEDNAEHFLNIPLSGVRDGKTEPEFSFNANHLPYFVGTNIANVASSSNTDYANCPLTFETSDASIAQVIDGTLHIYNKKESVTITIRQGENKDFSAGVAYFTFTPRERPERAVPMQLVKSIYNEGTVEPGSKCKWLDDDGGCIRVGNNNAVVDDWIWYNSEKNFTIAFDGTPGRLSFEYKNTAWLVTPDADHYTYEIQESSDGGTWHTIWYTDATTTEWTAVKEVTLNPSTRYLRFSFSGNYWGFYRNINISELVGYKYLRTESDGRYLSRGALWGTQAIVDDFGMACRISNYTNDNTNFYTRFLFVDNQQYLYEADNHEMFTDDGTAANTYNLWKQNVVDGTIITFQSGNAYPGDSRKDQYITLDGDALALTADAAAATRWQMEDYTEHEAYITAMMDREAAAAAAKDFGSSINTLAKVRTEIAENDFEMTHIDIPALALGEQKGEYRSGVAGTNAVYDNTISGLVPGFYRLTVKAFYRISSSDIAWTCHAAGMESVLAYIYANSVEYPLQSLYNSYHVSPLEASDELRGGHYYSTDLTSAGEAFEDEKRYLNDVYVYVPADEGLTTGTLHYGIKNPSYVPGAWLTYKDITLTRIARKEYIFEGTFVSDKENWEVGGNWNRESIPNEHHAVIIRSDVVIDDEVKAYSLVIENDAKVTVAPNGGLTVGAGGVRGASAEKLIFKAGTAEDGALKGQTGYLRISPDYAGAMPEATVEMYSIAYHDMSRPGDDVAVWQAVGAPISDAGVSAKSVYTKSWIYSWDEEADDWVNNRKTLTFTPFTGYITSQYKYPDGITLTYDGHIVSGSAPQVIDLAYSGDGKGHNLLANSYAAPIDISRFNVGDFYHATPTIYIQNAGTCTESSSQMDGLSAEKAAAPGQYLAIPVNTAASLASTYNYPILIPAMQGFWVDATADDGTLTLDYNRLVWNANYSTRPNVAMRAPKKTQEITENESEELPQVGSLQISLEANGWYDNLFMLESESYNTAYEPGSDALKKESGTLNIFTIENDDKLAIDATNSILGTHVGVRTGEETAYTMTFSHVASGDDLALYDSETEQSIDINEGTQYTFFAEPNAMITKRFEIVERADAPTVTTDVDQVTKGVKVHKFIKDNQLFVLKNGVLYNAMGIVVR